MREKREHQRVIYVVPVSVHSKQSGEPLCEAQSQDISVGGLFLTTEYQPSIGVEVFVRMTLPQLGGVELPGYIRWVKTGGFGVQFGLLGPRETHTIGKLVRGSYSSLESAGANSRP